MRSFLVSDRGATAIEYAIIAALIGLGIVGSLVSTRGSLSAVFGTAGSQMGSATAAGSGQASSPYGSLTGNSSSTRTAYWQGKTLAAAPTKTVDGSVSEWNYAFTDGTTAKFSKGGSGNYATRMSVYDPTLNMRFLVTTNSAGAATADVASYYNANMQVDREIMSDVIYGHTWNGTEPTTQWTRTFTYSDPSPTAAPTGGSSGFTVESAGPDFVGLSVRGYQDLRYFLDTSR